MTGGDEQRSFRTYVAETRKHFDDLAASYDRVRPGYPAELYQRIADYAALRGAEHLLEVGVGTGQATLPFAERGHAILGLEPGARLAELGRVRLAGFPAVRIENTSFESWAPIPARFRLAYAAQAYHWLDPAVRIAKLVSCLDAKGVLAIFGNVPRATSGLLGDELQAVYRRLAPALFNRRAESSWYGTERSPVMTDFTASTELSDIQFETFTWSRALSGSAYVELLSTYSDHAALPDAKRSALFDGVAEAIDRHGGLISLDHSTGLFIARRRS